MNGDYAEYIETEVLPRVEKNCKVKLTKDPNGRAAMGNSSGGSAALIMAWFRTDLYHRVLTTSGTFVNQAWPFDSKYPDSMGFSRDAHSQQSQETAAYFSVCRRCGFAQSQRDDATTCTTGLKPITAWPRC
jgi:enterochelin esterase-like enzyme